MKKIFVALVFIFASFFLSIWQGFASVSNEKIAEVYERFSENIDKKYSPKRQQEILELLADSLDEYRKRPLSDNNTRILWQLDRHNNNYLFEVFTRVKNTPTQQKVLELRERTNLRNQTQLSRHPSYVNKLLEWGRQIYIVNDVFDFVDGNTIKKVRFSKFFPIDSNSNLKQLSSTQGIILYSLWDKQYRLIPEYTLEEKIAFSELQDVFDAFITDTTNYTQEGQDFYGYVFQKFKIIQDTYWVFLSDLERLGISIQNHVLSRSDDGEYRFVVDFTKKKLIDEDILDGVVDKQSFLLHILDDKIDLSRDTDRDFQKLKNTTRLLTAGKNSEEKIASVYDWVLNNVEYTREIDLEDSKIFSGIDTFVNNDGVCTGYTKLTSYMMMFAGVRDTEVIRGSVIDARDFPEIGHAWMRIGDRYYDPTFDDPVWATQNKTADQYRYYNLPRDLLYTNRFDYEDTPESYKTLSLQARNDIVAREIYTASSRYSPDSGYLLLQPAHFRKQHNISIDTQITPQVLAESIPVYRVDGNSFSFNDNGTQRQIRSLKFFSLNADNTESILNQLQYDFTDHYLFDWELPNGTREYRLWYDVVF